MKVEISDHNNYVEKYREVGNIKDADKILFARSIVLKEEYDLTTLPFQANIFVNEKLKDQLQKEFVKWDTFKEFTAREVSVL